MEGIIESGNFAFSGHPTKPNSPPEISLTGDTEIRGGNFVLAHITTNGFNLTITGGNCRGLRIDNVKQDSFAWRRKESLALAGQIRSTILTLYGQEGLESFDFAVELITANPTINEAQWNAKHQAWARKTGEYAGRAGSVNILDSTTALNRFIDSFFPGLDFSGVRDVLAQHDMSTWQGEATQISEEWN